MGRYLNVTNKGFRESLQSKIYVDKTGIIAFLNRLIDTEQKKYLDFLRRLMKDKPYIGLAYMTGILPIKKYGTHSALNMFDEYSMTDPRELAEFMG